MKYTQPSFIIHELFLEKLSSSCHCTCNTDALALGGATFGRGRGPILLDNVGCTGLEAFILECSHMGIGEHDCDHYEDASVSCQGILTIIIYNSCV